CATCSPPCCCWPSRPLAPNARAVRAAPTSAAARAATSRATG
ncbi:MAG: hypothetical protein AVDCRST_MAG21-28, partial [uncultured Nocardioidaceae bacterium]